MWKEIPFFGGCLWEGDGELEWAGKHPGSGRKLRRGTWKRQPPECLLPYQCQRWAASPWHPGRLLNQASCKAHPVPFPAPIWPPAQPGVTQGVWCRPPTILEHRNTQIVPSQNHMDLSAGPTGLIPATTKHNLHNPQNRIDRQERKECPKGC